MIAAVILAAGRSERMGRPKQLLPYRGTSFLRRAVNCAIEASCEPTFAVLGANLDEVLSELEGAAAEVVVNNEWSAGIGTSVSAGVRAVAKNAPEAEAVLLMTCDQPLIAPPLLRKLCKKFDGVERRIVASAYAGTLGVPAVFGRSLFAELQELAPESGAKGVIERHASDVLRVSWPAGAVDVDSSADYGDLIEKNYEIPD